jgi:zinc protease
VLPKLTFLWPTVGVHDRDAATVGAMAILLGGPSGREDDRTARLSKLLIYERNLATSVEVNQITDELAGIFLVEVLPRPGVSLTTIEQVVDSAVKALPTTPMTTTEAERLKNFLVVSRISTMQSVFGKARALGVSEIYFANPLGYVDQLERVMAVGPADIERAAARLFGKGRVVLSMVPAGKLDMISRPDLPYTNVTPVAAPVAK